MQSKPAIRCQAGLLAVGLVSNINLLAMSCVVALA